MKQYDLMIIDDEKRYVDMLAKRLKLRGCDSKVYYTGGEGVAALKRNRFHLVVLDLQLPDTYGTEILKQIKKIHPQMPVIILTGHGTEADRRACMQHGAMAFIHKPLDIGELLGFLEQVKKRAA